MGRWHYSGRLAAVVMVGILAFAALASSRAASSGVDHASTNANAALFRATYRAIADHYLKPLTPQKLAMTGLARLADIDSSLAVSHDDNDVVLRQWRHVIWRHAAPAPGNAAAWGRLTATLLDIARRYSGDVLAQPPNAIDTAVIDGSLGLLDRFSRYAPPVQATEHRDSRDGYGGIGVTLERDGDGVRIAMVMPNSPAAGAGLDGGDAITAINGTATRTLSPGAIAARMRGRIGSTLDLTVVREEGSYPVTIMLRRAHIVVRSVALRELGQVAALRVSSFNARTADELAAALALAHRDMGTRLRGLVLDLRDNPGGLVDQAVRVASMFLDHGLVVSTIGRVPESNQIFDVTRDRPAERLPLVVLVNGGSASASEIVASALQDDHRAIIVGTSSYGKGTVQDVIGLPNNGELTVTWAKLIPPGGYILHHHGVVPVVCTDGVKRVAAAVPVPGVPRAGLSNRGWIALRAQCPPMRIDRPIDLKIAERLLLSPARYVRALADEPAKPIQAAAANIPMR
ncbi:MAG: S41 family peptidase [Stellaceae bacterium]